MRITGEVPDPLSPKGKAFFRSPGWNSGIGGYAGRDLEYYGIPVVEGKRQALVWGML